MTLDVAAAPALPDRFEVVHVDQSLGERDRALAGSVAAIGNFDGLHRGHAAVVEHARELAAGLCATTVLLTFEPHPRAFFRPGEPFFRLTPEPLKLALARRMGLDGAIVLRFDEGLAAMAAGAFVDALLGRRLGLIGVAVGDDFRFGKDRAGSPAFLTESGLRIGLATRVTPALRFAEAPISSSEIRRLLAGGEVEAAADRLGYRWIVRSSVRHGDRRGRELGYPTANFQMMPDCGLRHGVYAVRIAVDGWIGDGVASFGRRPTFDDGEPLLEVFIFDFAGDLYGKPADIEFVGWIRPEERFDDVRSLVAQMDRDSLEARRILAGPGKTPSLLPL